MFSGPGISAFFQPIRAAGTETVPAQAIAALRKVGDETGNGGESFQDKAESHPRPATTDDTSADDAFTKDHTTLSIPALRALLGGEDVAHAAKAEDRDDTAPEIPPAMRAATAAYQHAATVKPPEVPQVPDGFTPPPRDRASAADILLMLARIEAAGMHQIAVRDGSSIYDTLVALCWSLQR